MLKVVELLNDVNASGAGHVVTGYFLPNGSFIIDEQYLAGKDNPYWDSDEYDSLLVVDMENGQKFIDLVGTTVADLPTELQELFSQIKLFKFSNLLKQNGIEFRWYSLSPDEILDGKMSKLIDDWKNSYAE